jgi:hypothetical protein
MKLVVLVLVMGSFETAFAQPSSQSPSPSLPPPPGSLAPIPPPPPPPGYGTSYAPVGQPPLAEQPPVDRGPRMGHIELVADFAAVGLLSTVAALDARDYDDKDTGTLLVMGGTLGAGAVGWLVADKLEVTRAEAHAASMGLGLGVANAALLLVPLHAEDESSQVLATLAIGSGIGVVGGLAVGKKLRLTEGQATFAGNLALLGVGTAAITAALIDDDDGEADSGEMSALAIGLDAGAIAGLAIAPKIDWSRRRARYVGMSSLAGLFVGSLVGALAATDKDDTGSSHTDPDIAATGVLVGMWGGFAAGIALTGDFAPDPSHTKAAPTSTPTSLLPLVGPQREVGITIAGGF